MSGAERRLSLPFGALLGEGPGDPRRREVLYAGSAPVVAALAAAVWPTFLPPGLRALLWSSLLFPPALLAVYRGRRGALVGFGVSLVTLLAGEVAFRLILGRPVWWGLVGGASVLTGVAAWVLAEVTHRLHVLIRGAVRKAYRDEETGLPRRELTEIFLDQYFAAARRGDELTVVLFGVEGLSELRRNHGERAAGGLLGRVGEAIESNSRGMDVAGRMAEEEIVALLPDTEVEGARTFAARVLEKLTGLSAEAEDGSLMGAGVSVRAGIAGFEEEVEDSDALVDRARRALESATGPSARRIRIFSGP